MSLLEEGKDFGLKQIASGINAFGSVSSDELDAFHVLSVQSEGGAAEVERGIGPTDESQREEEQGEGVDEEDEEDEKAEEQAFEVATSRDNELLMFGMILDELDDLAPLCSVSLRDKVCAWQLPQQICQSLFNQRNGSSACSLI